MKAIFGQRRGIWFIFKNFKTGIKNCFFFLPLRLIEDPNIELLGS